ncbi:hypothetical protein [Candidatus Magnetaquicoccus inordinatus]|nr:hypothetical protein [Candidatus Magnetaquicoccus inordinatus]
MLVVAVGRQMLDLTLLSFGKLLFGWAREVVEMVRLRAVDNALLPVRR